MLSVLSSNVNTYMLALLIMFDNFVSLRQQSATARRYFWAPVKFDQTFDHWNTSHSMDPELQDNLHMK